MNIPAEPSRAPATGALLDDRRVGDTGSPAPGGAGATTATRPLPDDALIVLPVRNLVVFPATVLPIGIGRERSQAAVQEAVRLERPIGVLLQSKPDVDEPGPDDLHWVGTSADVLRYVTAPDGGHHVVARGLRRFRVLQFLDGWPFTVVRVQYIDDPDRADPEIEGRARVLRERALETLQLLPQVPAEMSVALQGIDDPAQLANVISSVLDVPAEEKQSLLETFDLKSRLDRLLAIVARRIEVLKVSRDVADRTRESIGDVNRKHLLREQMRTIQKELGEGDEGAAEIEELAKAIDEAHMPEEVEKVARKELKRLERMPEAAGEYSMVRTYLDWLVELPWGDEPEPPIDIAEARRILDEDHFGLDKIKRRILEHLAVRKLNPSGKSPILCFVGPPGVGKTSLGQSIAKATGRKFARVSLGGVHDEAEIRGHRRTYIGALPGNIIQSLRKAGTRNPVMMLDEIDKLGAGGFHGDPASALLEVLDPEQNSTFRDNYLAVPYDLSKVMFVAHRERARHDPRAAARPHGGDRAARLHRRGEAADRASRYLVPRQLAATGITGEQCEIRDDALMAIIVDYTREAGVRNLEREIGSVCRHVAVRIAEGTIARLNVDCRRPARDPRRQALRGRGRDAHRHPRRRHRAGVDAGRRRHPLHRGGANARQRPAHPHRPARRRDEGKRAGGAVAGQGARCFARHPDREPRQPRQGRHPRPRPGRRDAEGRAERGRRDVRRADVAAQQPAGAKRRRDDRRDHACAAWCCRSAASRRRCSRRSAPASRR